MMQMLAAGGMLILTDGQRQPDIENPRGYYEWEPAKLLPQRPELIQEAEGKALKVISQLLFALPRDRQYQVIFMDRPLTEVVASQTGMIRRRTSAPALPASTMIAALQTHLNQVRAWLASQSNLSVYPVRYGEVISTPQTVADGLQDFLNRALNTEAMAAQVDTALYRQRLSAF